MVLITWALVASALLVLVHGVVRDPGPRDDPDPSRPRSGLLVDPEDAAVVPDLGLAGGALGRRPILLLFDREGPPAQQVRSVLDGLPEDVVLVLVTPSSGRDAAASVLGVDVVVDPERRLAGAVGLSAPKDGGFPTGYALIDREQRVRYATLDPGYADHVFEIHILVQPLSSG